MHFLHNRKSPANRVSAILPFGIGSVEIESSQFQSQAAWALYVELVTRIATQQVDDSSGSIRESLNSLYVLFPETRKILKDLGSEVGASLESIGGIAIAVLNRGLRPFLVKWHPLLHVWEYQRPENVNPREHEQKWGNFSECRSKLELLKKQMVNYADLLAKIAGLQE